MMFGSSKTPIISPPIGKHKTAARRELRLVALRPPMTPILLRPP